LDIDCGRYEFTCPVRALRNWIEAAQITSGRLFRHIKKGGRLEHVREELNDLALFYILKRYVEQAELTGKKLTPIVSAQRLPPSSPPMGSMASKFKKAAAGAITIR
jgi:hypothetical protein